MCSISFMSISSCLNTCNLFYFVSKCLSSCLKVVIKSLQMLGFINNVLRVAIDCKNYLTNFLLFISRKTFTARQIRHIFILHVDLYKYFFCKFVVFKRYCSWKHKCHSWKNEEITYNFVNVSVTCVMYCDLCREW